MMFKKRNEKNRNKKAKNDYEGKIKCRIKIDCHQKFRCSILGVDQSCSSTPGSGPDYGKIQKSQ